MHERTAATKLNNFGTKIQMMLITDVHTSWSKPLDSLKEMWISGYLNSFFSNNQSESVLIGFIVVKIFAPKIEGAIWKIDVLFNASNIVFWV